jgi:hypothetical protein
MTNNKIQINIFSISDLNWTAIFICTLVSQLVPAVWYGVFFQTYWAGKDNVGAIAYLNGFILWFGTILTLAWLFKKLHVVTISTGLAAGLLIGLSMHFFPLGVGNGFANVSRLQTCVHGGYYLIVMGVSGMILGGWKQK